MSDEEPIFYHVELTEPAEAEIETAILNRLRRTSAEAVTIWHDGLRNATDSLYLFPRRNERVRFGNFEGDVRRIIYGRGPSAYYIIYRVIDPTEDQTDGIVRILHVQPAARHSRGQASDEDEP